MLGWLGKNLPTLILAFVIAAIVWISAEIASDPNEERVHPRPIPIEVIGLKSDMVQVAEIPDEIALTLTAPRSVWVSLVKDQEAIRAWIDLSGLPKGTHTVPVNVQVSLSPVRINSIDPEGIKVDLEPFVIRDFPVELTVTGDPAIGYRKGTPVIEPEVISISGPEDLVDQVAETAVSLDISGSNETIKRSLIVQPRSDDGKIVTEITISPPSVTVTQPVNLLGGYRNIIVKVVTSGEVADGYWLTNVSVNPPSVVVFSSNPTLVNQLPGFVETIPIDLTGLNDDVDIRANLNLPDEITLVGEETVLVRLSIAASEGNLPITLPIETIGLIPEYEAVFSPDTVNLILTGPLPLLTNLTPSSIRVIVNVSGLEPGVHQVVPEVDLLPNEVRVESLQPETVSVTITVAPTPTPTPEIEGSDTAADSTPTTLISTAPTATPSS